MKKLHVLALATLALLATPVASFANHWTSVCAVGAIDESTVSNYAFANASLQFASLKTGSVFARYNVTNTSTSASTPAYTTLELGYSDSGAGTSATVDATLYEVDPCTGSIRTLCTVTGTDLTTDDCNTCTFASTEFNFATDLYYVIVRLNRTSTAAFVEANTLRIY